MESTKEIVWVFGASASGKATFIQAVTDSPQRKVLDQFGWTGKSIVACEESLNLIASDGSDPVIFQREVILESAVKLAEKAQVVLIKGQNADLSRGRPSRFQRLLQTAHHRIIFIDVGLEELHSWVSEKPWLKPDVDIPSETLRWLTYQKRMLSKLVPVFEIEAISADTGKTYNPVSLHF